MIRKSRILTLIFALLVIVSALATTVFSESTDGTVSVIASDIIDGKFTATVKISGNPGISGMSLRLSFDRTKLTPVSFDASNGLYPEAYSNMTEDGADLTAIDSVTYFFASSDDIKKDGELFRVTFNVSDEAVGTTELGISYATGGVTNSKFNDLFPDVSDCTVDISSAKYPAGIITLESEHLGLDYYRVDVGLYGNMSLAALRFKLALSDSVSVRSVDFDGIFDGVTSNSTQPGVILSSLKSITYNYTNTENVSKTGKLFSFTFRLVDGFGKISVSYENGDVVNSDLEILSPHKSSLTFGTLDVATVSFDANTSLTLNGESPSEITFVRNGYITLPFCPEREDKAYFLGWSESKSATSATYKPGEKYLVLKDVTLYAVWTIRTYTVTYNANGGSNAPAAQTKVHGTPITLSSTIPTRANYDFVGWSALKNGSAADFSAGDVYAENVSITLYAIWRPHGYVITFDANGGVGAPSPTEKFYGTNILLPTEIPSKSDAGFAGWTDTKNGSAKYLPGSPYSGNGSVTLYAVWTSDKYDVTFDANGGANAPTSLSLAKTLDLIIPLTAPEKAGYAFLGWSESKNATTSDYKIGDTFSKKASTTLYAVWEIAKYTVTFDTNGGNGSFTPLTFSFGGSATISTATPTKTGFDFLGWAESPDATVAEYAAGGTFAYNRSTTLYAVWSAHKYRVTYVANGGTNAPAAHHKLYGTDLRLSAVKPIREGFTFIGWAESASAAEPTYRAGDLYTENRDITLYALWTPTTYDIVYDINGGNSGTVGTEKKIHGTPLAIASFFPVKTGYTFIGWAYSPNAISPDFTAGDLYTKDESVTLYAVWTIKEYTVIYDANGGTWAPGAQKKPHGATLALANIEPEYDGHIFIGWSSSVDGTAVEYLPGDTYTADADLTLYAIWCEEAGAANAGLTVKSVGGGKIKVEMLLTSNPGINSISLRLNFDRSKVKLVEITANDDDEPESVLSGLFVNFDIENIPESTSYINLSWSSASNRKATGVILTATFEALCEAGECVDFSISVIKDTTSSGKKIPTGVEKVTFTVPDYMPGDLNDDGKVNATDAVMLAQFLANWDVEMNEDAADCNGDGVINAKDSVMLAQYLANWDVTLG